MPDYSNDFDCCLNCEDRICNRGERCLHCLCKRCDWYEYYDYARRGYCSLVRGEAADREDFKEDF